jgi:hypothetical protein
VGRPAAFLDLNGTLVEPGLRRRIGDAQAADQRVRSEPVSDAGEAAGYRSVRTLRAEHGALLETLVAAWHTTSCL